MTIAAQHQMKITASGVQIYPIEYGKDITFVLGDRYKCMFMVRKVIHKSSL